MKKVIQSTKTFEKSFKKLNQKLKDRFLEKLDIFIDNEFDKRLWTHNLKWNRKDEYSFSVTDDIRVIYRKKVEWSKEILIFTLIDIWSHNKVY